MPLTTPFIVNHTRSGKDGRWSYSERKVGRLYIEAIPPLGYEDARNLGEPLVASIGPFYDGDQPTNDFILLFRKLPEAPAGGR